MDERTQLLILGSLPGEESLLQAQYYANKRNAFWYLMSQVLGVDLVRLSYQDRLSGLLDHRVGLWDVVAQAARQGSLDGSIRQVQTNDLVSLVTRYPRISAFAFNGQTAAKLGLKCAAPIRHRIDILALPSSSPAHTLALPKKVECWLSLRSVLE